MHPATLVAKDRKNGALQATSLASTLFHFHTISFVNLIFSFVNFNTFPFLSRLMNSWTGGVRWVESGLRGCGIGGGEETKLGGASIQPKISQVTRETLSSRAGRRYPAYQWPGPGSWGGGESPAGGARWDGGVAEWGLNFCSRKNLNSNICVMIGGRVPLAWSLWLLVVVWMWRSKDFIVVSKLTTFTFCPDVVFFVCVLMLRPQCLIRIRMNWKYSPLK